MKYASEDLINEHEGILFGLKILEEMVSRNKKSENTDISDLREMINFLKLFADKCHHGKEEGLLFPAMEKFGIMKEGGPIGQMLLEHEEGRKYIAQMSQAVNQDLLQAENFNNAAMHYINLLRLHINKENTVLFPLGDKKIPEPEQQRLIDLFEKHEEEVMGKGTHEKLHELLHNFEHKYLSKEK